LGRGVQGLKNAFFPTAAELDWTPSATSGRRCAAGEEPRRRVYAWLGTMIWTGPTATSWTGPTSVRSWP